MPKPQNEPAAHGMTRRTALAMAGAMAAAGATIESGCRRAPVALRRAAPVTIAKCAGDTGAVYGIVRGMLAELEPRVRGKRIVLKPNMVEYSSTAPVSTHPVVVHAALEALRAMGAREVRIAEGPGHRRITLEMAEAMGYMATIPGFEQLFTDLNLDDIAEVRLKAPASRLSSLHLPVTALGADLLISMPKLKTHHWVGATASMKNLFGTVPGAVYGWPKNVLHWAGIPECVNDCGASIRTPTRWWTALRRWRATVPSKAFRSGRAYWSPARSCRRSTRPAAA